MKTLFISAKLLIAGLCASFILNNSTLAQEKNELDVLRNNWRVHDDASDPLYKYLTGEAFRLLENRSDVVRNTRNINDWKVRQEEVKQKLWEIMGPFGEKTPFKAKITSRLKKNGYNVENLIYESLPGFYVTASLFIPEKVKKPAPAILFCSGHSAGAYRLESYQLPLLNLVKKGFIVLAIDPVGQGERLQYLDPEKGESIIGGSTKEHSYAAAQVFLTGRSVARYFLWDGIRGIDYLVSRKEVDPARIGVHGLSGGGTQTAYISALDDRVAASAPACYITNFRRLLESIGVQDGEQNLYKETYMGIDHADFIEARAPKPTLIMANTRDFFSIQGTRETYSELKNIYSIFGKPGNIEIIEDDYGHGYTKINREAMYSFFQRHLNQPGSPLEEKVEFTSAGELQKTSTGQLSTSLGGESLYSLNRNDAEKMLDNLQSSRKNFPAYLGKVLTTARELSGFTEPDIVQEPVFTGRFQRENYVIEKYFLPLREGYVIPYLLMIPDKPNNKGLIYLHENDKAAEAHTGGEIEWFVKKGFTVLAPDLIGMGEMYPGSLKGDAIIGGVSYNTWFTSIIINKSIAGIRAGDICKLAMLLKKRSETGEIYALARKEMAPVMIYLSAFYPDISRMALINPYSSYKSIVMNRFYSPGFVQNLVPGALTAYDLPDLAATIAPRKLVMTAITDGNSNNTDQEMIRNDLEIIKKSYQYKKVPEQFIIVPDKPGEKPYDLFMELIK